MWLKMSWPLRKTLLIAALVAMPVLLLINGCSQSRANRNPTGERFPIVKGQSLDGKSMQLPDALSGEPAVLLIGYKKSAQFDIDRWLMGLIQADVGVQIIEIPIIPGLSASVASKWIDEGMRAGIPKEDWGSVVTVYGNAAKPIADLTGTEKGQLARIMVLNREGKIIWFDDKGYAARKALEVAAIVAGQEQSSTRNPDETAVAP